VSIIHHQEPLQLPHNIELGCDTTVGISERAYNGVNRQFGKRATKKVRMMPPHLHPKFQDLSICFLLSDA